MHLSVPHINQKLTLIILLFTMNSDRLSILVQRSHLEINLNGSSEQEFDIANSLFNILAY